MAARWDACSPGLCQRRQGVLSGFGGLNAGRLRKVQSVDQRMRLEGGVGFRELRTCRRTHPG
jgi:hypothetical protein